MHASHPSSPELVSVIIPALDSAATLPAQLDALTEQTYTGSWEVIVADNGSTDGTSELVAKWEGRLPGLRVVDASHRPGVAAAANAGAREARGDLLLFCESDDVVAPGWIAGMVSSARYFDLVGGRLESASLNDPVTRSWRSSNIQEEGLPMSRFLPFAMGANIGVWASVFDALGGWDEDFLRSHDVEFCWRAQLSSYRLGFAPDAVVSYRHRASIRGLARQAYGWGTGAANLYSKYRRSGIPPPPSFGEILSVWIRLLGSAPRALGSTGSRGRWIRRVAYRWGRVRGGIRYRVWAP